MSDSTCGSKNLKDCRSHCHSQPWISSPSQDNKFPNSLPALNEQANPFFPGGFDLNRVQLSLSVLQLDPPDRAVIKIADKRDAIQKKVFTNWVNHYLSKRNCWVQDLFLDLRSGYLLVRLLEILTNEVLGFEYIESRVHWIQNVQRVLNFLRYRGVSLCDFFD
ncbi:putative Microtubule-actin cross-linking factor [Fasciola hepatica]|uniref:Microtubule-actin cross-linking factor n=1 Tax=Fasciola hepatica TaxID=6192 RepID=A0A4E0R5Q8_FASHE|nr:putative Microtubule-actin cross-linking factor [Fasciola hepatica]